jgi:hypothetical protein
MPVAGLWSIGVRPMLAGAAVILAAAVAGWGISPDVDFPPVRFIRWWVEHAALRIIRHPSWVLRAVAIFVNNSAVCAVLVLAGGLPTGAWVGVTVAGLSLGIAMGLLSRGGGGFPLGRAPVPPESRADLGVLVGVALNVLEIPAIVVAVGLAMGRLAAPNRLSGETVWMLFVSWVVPALAVAAGGESLWIGRQRGAHSRGDEAPSDADDRTA